MSLLSDSLFPLETGSNTNNFALGELVEVEPPTSKAKRSLSEEGTPVETTARRTGAADLNTAGRPEAPAEAPGVGAAPREGTPNQGTESR